MRIMLLSSPLLGGGTDTNYGQSQVILENINTQIYGTFSGAPDIYIVSYTGSQQSSNGSTSIAKHPVPEHSSGDLLLAFTMSSTTYIYTPAGSWDAILFNQWVDSDRFCIFSKISDGTVTGLTLNHFGEYWESPAIILAIRNQGDYSGCINYSISSSELVTDSTKEVPQINIPSDNSLVLHGFFSNYSIGGTNPSNVSTISMKGTNQTVKVCKQNDLQDAGTSPAGSFSNLGTYRTFKTFTISISKNLIQSNNIVGNINISTIPVSVSSYCRTGSIIPILFHHYYRMFSQG